MKTGPFIREQRLKKGMTQEDLAAKTGSSARTIQRIENSEVEARAYTLQNIAAALEVDFELLNNLNAAETENSVNVWLPLLHLSGLFNLLLPSLLIWLVKRHRVKEMQNHGPAVINFQLSMLLYEIGYVFLLMILMPNAIYFGPTWMILLLLVLFSLAMVMVNTIKVLNGQPYRYPLSLRILKPSTAQILVLVMLMGCHEAVCAQDKTGMNADSAFVNWAKKQAVPISGDHLQAIDVIVGNAQVVALGEPAHGFHETLSLRNSIFRYLVEHKGFTAIALETDFLRSRLATNIVAGGNGDIGKAAGALTIAGATQEDIELISWMRDYNAQPGHRAKLKFYGMDMELIGLPGDTTPMHQSIDQAISYLQQVDPKEAAHFSKRLAPLLPRLSVANYPKLSAAEHAQLSGILNELIAVFQQHQAAYSAASSLTTFKWACQNAVVARQTELMVSLMPPDQSGRIPPAAWRSSSARDSAMAQNVLWILAQGEKVFVYAHNNHIKNAPTTGGVWDAFAQPARAEGQYLRSALGSRLVIFGISMAQPFDIKQPASLETALAKTGKSDFLLNLRSTGNAPEAANWLSEVRPMQTNIGTFTNVATGTAFDAVIYLAKGTPASRVK